MGLISRIIRMPKFPVLRFLNNLLRVVDFRFIIPHKCDGHFIKMSITLRRLIYCDMDKAVNHRIG